LEPFGFLAACMGWGMGGGEALFSTLLPQLLQNIVSSTRDVPHFKQNINIPPEIMYVI